MKELSIEEKAKRYDEAIKKLRDFYRDYDTVSCLINVKEELANLFPEVKESEDERIRKALISYIKQTNYDNLHTWNSINLNVFIAWLEKQSQTFTKKDVDDAYLKGIYDAKQELEKQGEQKPTAEEMKELLHTEYEKGRADAIEEMQNHTWSEKDEKVIHCLEYTVRHFYEDEDTIKWCCDWLKSLKERYTWKPSDEQIKGIECAIKTLQHQLNVGDKRLNSLYDDLKKLREE